MTRLDDTALSRRGVLRAAAGTATAVAAGTAAIGAAAAQAYDGWFSGDAKGGAVGNYDGTTVDRTGTDEVTIDVGVDANGGTYGFGPAAVRVDPGTTVSFEWVSNTHNILIDAQPDGADWGGHDPIENTGFTHTHTFDTEGVYTYYCNPHLTMGMKGAIVVGGDSGGGGGGGSDQPTVAADYGDWFTKSADGGATGNYTGDTTDKTGTDEVTVEVGADANGGTYGFGPAAVRVDPGTTVTFKWTSNTHNVLVQSQPDGADWGGHEPIENEGFTHTHTFETAGVYTYYCNPHLTMGMKGAIVVGAPPGGTTGGGGGGAAGSSVSPASTLWTAVFAGAVGVAMLVPVAVSYYRRTPAPDSSGAFDYEPGGDTDDQPAIPEADAFEPDTELGHDEYDPVGTLSIVAVYFLILVGMWAFTYFIEFLGNGPTIMG
ncbi:halocyanin domain-containing protein [Halobacterium salinarum]|uniref:halocyanin domain-containing protein n=1 Tax=Halobacterium TaxID=2239 RepID=UPI001966C196|nr:MULTISPECIES: halocyanin domain-containing protein [Halobacterium]MCF2238897.1 halocyanin domain-containing protein [Halobacterium salinarum]MDL0140136.1 halocyanin domain-containing protein [Halobacterium salinarum]QRY22379.1 halocyanin domain-containing protein [Halobacterium sp. GSL-19]WJK63746.1 halocyanin domain-containing protein [Halobacterium salinarum]